MVLSLRILSAQEATHDERSIPISFSRFREDNFRSHFLTLLFYLLCVKTLFMCPKHFPRSNQLGISQYICNGIHFTDFERLKQDQNPSNVKSKTIRKILLKQNSFLTSLVFSLIQSVIS